MAGEYYHDVVAEREGRILWFNNRDLVKIARAAGTPNDKGAGIQLYAKTGDKVSTDKPMFRVFAEKQEKLENAITQLKVLRPVEVGEKVGEEMLKKRIRKLNAPTREFILER